MVFDWVLCWFQGIWGLFGVDGVWAMMKVNILHKFTTYGAVSNPRQVDKIVSYCQIAHLKDQLNMSAYEAFGGKGMSQTVGVAHTFPSG